MICLESRQLALDGEETKHAQASEDPSNKIKLAIRLNDTKRIASLGNDDFVPVLRERFSRIMRSMRLSCDWKARETRFVSVSREAEAHLDDQNP